MNTAHPRRHNTFMPLNIKTASLPHTVDVEWDEAGEMAILGSSGLPEFY